jgi:hypothetical protein
MVSSWGAGGKRFEPGHAQAESGWLQIDTLVIIDNKSIHAVPYLEDPLTVWSSIAHPRSKPVCWPCRRFACGFLQIHLAMGTLAVRLTLPPVGRAGDFHLQQVRPAGRTKNEGQGAKPWPPSGDSIHVLPDCGRGGAVSWLKATFSGSG